MKLADRLARLEAQLAARAQGNQAAGEAALVHRLAALSGRSAGEVVLDLPLVRVVAEGYGLTVEQVFLMPDDELAALAAEDHDEA